MTLLVLYPTITRPEAAGAAAKNGEAPALENNVVNAWDKETADAAAKNGEVTALLPLDYLDARAMSSLLTADANSPQQQGTLRNFISKGISMIAASDALHALLVTADSADTVTQFKSLIQLLDQPVKHCWLEAQLVQAPLNLLGSVKGSDGKPQTITEYMQAHASAAVRMEPGAEQVTSLLRQGKATVISHAMVYTRNGSEAILPLDAAQSRNSAELVQQVTIHPDNTISLTLTDIPRETAAADAPRTTRSKDGQLVIHSYAVSLDKAHPEDTQQLMLLITPYVAPAAF